MIIYSNAWLSRVISWFQQSYTAAGCEPDNVQVDEAGLEEYPSSVRKLETLYISVQNGFRESQRVGRQ